jgi:streptogramin lyase
MADNAIHEIDPETGTAREVIKGRLSSPRSIAAAPAGKSDDIYVGDTFAFRKVDGRTGEVSDIARSHAADTPIAYANSVTANDKHVLLTNSNGIVQSYDRRTLKPVRQWPDLRGAQAALELTDGSILVANVPRGALTRLSGANGERRKTIATDLNGPVVLAVDAAGEVFVNESGAGQVSQIDLTHGTKRVVASGLRTPQGLAIGTDGSLFVIERDAHQLTRIDARTGTTEAVATNLPVGRHGVESSSAGVTAGSRGTLYVMSDIENSIYRLEPVRGR